jgi:uncharacterized protein (TIGR01777 family)
MQPTRTIILPGGSGYLGQHLAPYLVNLGYQVVILSRNPTTAAGSIRQIEWDGQTLGPWSSVFNNAHAVINLAGKSVNCRYNTKNKQEIYDSRLASTKVVGQAIAAATSPPPVWINSSSATIYRDVRDRAMDEFTGEIGSGFSVDVCKKWEQTLADANTPHTRKIALRSAMVFGPGKAGVFEAFHRIVKLGLGGTLGPGDQFVSWVQLKDFCRAIEFLIECDKPECTGPVNLASPNPLPNRQFMQILREESHKLIGLPATKWMLQIGAFVLRTETELLLKSRRVVPGKLLAAGFEFRFPELRDAVQEILESDKISS